VQKFYLINTMKNKTKNTTLLEQYQNLIEKYHTVGTIPKSNRKTKNTTLLEQYQNLIEKYQYHTVGTVPKSNRKIPHC